MNSKALGTLAALATTILSFPPGASGQAKPACTEFTVVTRDKLNNVKQGLSAEDVKWFQTKAKKYPGACYVTPGPNVPVVFYITVTPDVYHGTRIVRDQSTHSDPVSGTVTDQNGNVSQVSGTAQTTTTTSTAVPYSVEYGIYTLSVERRRTDGKFEVAHTFQQKGLYNTMYGIPLGGKGHHPVHTVVEDAAKWIGSGELALSEPKSPPVDTSARPLTQSGSLAVKQQGQSEDMSKTILPSSPSLVGPLKNEDVLKLSRAGVGDEVIVEKIRNAPADFRVEPDDLIALKNAGLSNTAIAAMVRAQGTRSLAEPLTGTYTGIVTNLTVGQSADFTITVAEGKDGDLRGCMEVKLPLGGSGYLQGMAQGPRLSFVVVSDLAQIKFEGQRDADKLKGTYFVTPKIRGNPEQQGSFSLHRTSLYGPSSGFKALDCPK